MADVRSLLQNERANRRIVHPYARYSESGKLTCSLCDIPIKSENAWKGHTRTPDHASRALRAAEASAQRNSKKRKADSDDDEEEEESRKRARGRDEEEEQPEPPVKRRLATPRRVRFADEVENGSLEATEEPDIPEAQPEPPLQVTVEDDPENDPEWLELQKMVRDSGTTSGGSEAFSNATISAAPMTAEEVAAQAREEQSTQRETRQAELEGEKEDAAQALEAEFDEMHELEQRVRKLREKRELLRSSSLTDSNADEQANEPANDENFVEDVVADNSDGPSDIEENDDSDGGEDDVWNFGAD